MKGFVTVTVAVVLVVRGVAVVVVVVVVEVVVVVVVVVVGRRVAGTVTGTGVIRNRISLNWLIYLDDE